MSAGIWLSLPQIAALYTHGRYDTARNWVRRGRVEHRRQHGALEVNAETVEAYLRDRNPEFIRKDYRKGGTA